ncbi:MAG: hypothetical protein IKH59_08565 [Bacteroidaceae bacterium]|nr:hypothetical protein [Bacteroidaceae bacterium]
MALPTKDQISNSIESGGNICDPKLIGYNTIEGVIGPECYSGGFCLVYPVSNGKNKYAFRVWHTEIEGIKERLIKISQYLDTHKLPYFVDFCYVENALRVFDDEGNQQTIDAVTMEWVNGKNLVAYIDTIVSDASLSDTEKKKKIATLASRFKEMVCKLHQINVAHGDLQHGNIIVDDDESLKLVDYDSVYVPTFINEEQVTSGMAAYQHPCRKNRTFMSSKFDDFFSEQIIYLSLLCFSEDLTLWEPLEERDEYSLLFTEADYLSLSASTQYKKIRRLPNKEIQLLLDELEQNLSYPDITHIRPLELVLKNKYEEQPNSVFLEDNDISFLLGDQKKKAVYKDNRIQLPDFDEEAARQRYSQNQ